MGNTARTLMLTCLIAVTGCETPESDDDMPTSSSLSTTGPGARTAWGAAGSPAPSMHPPATTPTTKTPTTPETMEAATTVYAEQSSRVLAGGGLELVYDFVVLFRDGWSTWRLASSVLETPEADRAAKPETWVKWRRNAQGRPERLLKGDKWTVVPGAEYKASAPGRTLNRSYSYIQIYSGNSVTRDVTFRANGQFESTSRVNGGSAVSKHGTYKIDGYVLTLSLSDGKTEKNTLIISSGEEMILLNGTGYTR